MNGFVKKKQVAYPTLSLWYLTLYFSLSKRWDIPDELDCIASFLDLRFKFLNFLSENQIKSTKQSLKIRIELLETPASIPTTPHLNSTSIFLDFFNQNISSQPPISPINTEISFYLQIPALPVLVKMVTG
ncbi:6262_t:CDS:2, partial [Funneliformis geosporum]